MSGNIIDPWWFYWINVLEELKYAIEFAIYTICIIFIFVGIYYLIGIHFNIINEFMKKFLIKSAIAVCILGIAFIFIPSKETLIQMKLAENITYENVKIVEEKIKNTADYILDGLKKGDD